MRCMYPFERYMKVLKGYVRNRNHPEGCIAECYIAEEALEFCTEYLSGIDAIGIPSSMKDEWKYGKPLPGGLVMTINEYNFGGASTSLCSAKYNHYATLYQVSVVSLEQVTLLLYLLWIQTMTCLFYLIVII